jgi:DNA helicase-2/ATP-dependent DNA helicase PcrA
MNKPELSPEQQRVVRHGEEPLLLIASAGSGKTRILTERVRYLMENKTGHYHILALTFTNKAADEMRKRLDVDEQEEHLYIGNIHKFCMQMICNRGHVIGLSREPQIFERKDCLEVLRQAFDSDPRLQQIFEDNRL